MTPDTFSVVAVRFAGTLALILVRAEPSPENDVAVRTPVTTAPVLVVSNFLELS